MLPQTISHAIGIEDRWGYASFVLVLGAGFYLLTKLYGGSIDPNHRD